MSLTKIVNGKRVNMSAEEEALFLAESVASEQALTEKRIKNNAQSAIEAYKNEATELLLRQSAGEDVSAEIVALKNNIDAEKAKL